MVLSALGYENITIENAYEKAKDTILFNEYTQTFVEENFILARNDVVKIYYDVIRLSKTSAGIPLYKNLIEKGVFSQEDFDSAMLGIDEDVIYSETFADKLNARMPIDKNYMFSPLSIKMALALAANGAEGETKNEILSAINVSNIDAFNQSTKETIEKFSKTDILKLNIANSIWINKSKTNQNFSNTYKNKIIHFYNGEASVVDDKSAVKTINDWVNVKTNEKIPTIIEDNDFFAMLVNAIYFKGTWQNEFNENSTKKAEFTDKNGEKSEIDFMNQIGWMNYFENDNTQIVELPYNNRIDNFSKDGEYLSTDKYDDMAVSMFILLGNDRITDVETLLENTTLSSEFIKLSIPKFKIEYETSLNNILKDMGIQKAFMYGTAEFMPMFDKENMYITDTIHKTYITIDEKGTEATAVTKISMGGSAMPPKPIILNVNKPFAFVIRDNITREILFMGEYAYTK